MDLACQQQLPNHHLDSEKCLVLSETLGDQQPPVLSQCEPVNQSYYSPKVSLQVKRHYDTGKFDEEFGDGGVLRYPLLGYSL